MNPMFWVAKMRPYQLAFLQQFSLEGHKNWSFGERAVWFGDFCELLFSPSLRWPRRKYLMSFTLVCTFKFSICFHLRWIPQMLSLLPHTLYHFAGLPNTFVSSLFVRFGNILDITNTDYSSSKKWYKGAYHISAVCMTGTQCSIVPTPNHKGNAAQVYVWCWNRFLRITGRVVRRLRPSTITKNAQ